MASISIAMIVKDEADHLPECIASFRELADEICVVDTGSQDNTIGIAQASGCKTASFRWNNDFSSARNASLRLCSCPWIFVVDADERILSRDVKRIAELTTFGNDKCYRFVTRNYTDNNTLSDFVSCVKSDPISKGFAGWHPSWKVRLFPNLPEAHFVGHVHEMIHESLQQKSIMVITTDIPLYHYPLLRSRERIHDKQLLYVELGLEKIRHNPDNAKAHAELGAQYAEMGLFSDAMHFYKTAVSLAPREVEFLAELGGILHIVGYCSEAARALKLALRLDNGCVKAWRNLGVVYGAEGKWQDAIDCFVQAIRLNPNNADLLNCLDTARRYLSSPENSEN